MDFARTGWFSVGRDTSTCKDEQNWQVVADRLISQGIEESEAYCYASARYDTGQAVQCAFRKFGFGTVTIVPPGF